MKAVLFFTLIFFSAQVFSQQKNVDTVKLISINSDDFERVEVEAQKDDKAWKTFLAESLQKIIDKASKKGLPAGNYSFNVRFIIDTTGKITEVTIDEDPGYGIGKSIIKMFKKAPKWVPGMQNGKKVKSFHTQPISFQVSS